MVEPSKPALKRQTLAREPSRLPIKASHSFFPYDVAVFDTLIIEIWFERVDQLADTLRYCIHQRAIEIEERRNSLEMEGDFQT